MKSVLPALSEEGWVSEPNKILDLCLSYYVTTDAQQSILYEDHIKSLPNIYQKHNFNPDELRAAIQRDLETLLRAYFPNTEVRVKSRANPDNDSEIFILISAVVFTDDGQRYELSKITHIANSVSRKILGYNNFGQADTAFNQLEFR